MLVPLQIAIALPWATLQVQGLSLPLSATTDVTERLQADRDQPDLTIHPLESLIQPNVLNG